MFKSIFTERQRVADERLAICRGCEHFEPERTKCKQCGCFMKYKTLIPSAECPIGKWGKDEKEETN